MKSLEDRQACIALTERALELVELAQSLAQESGNLDRYLRATRARVFELDIPGDPSSVAWDAAFQQRSEILWILDKALHGCMWDWDRSPLEWVALQLELRLASLRFPPQQTQLKDQEKPPSNAA